MKRIILVLQIIGFSMCQDPNLESLECPFPDGPSASSQSECALWSACEWTNNVCHMQSNSVAGYKVTSDPQDTGNGFKVNLQKFDAGVTMFDADILDLVLEVIYHEDYHVQIKIYDPSDNRYEVPFSLNVPTDPGTNPLYSVTVSDIDTPLTFSVSRKSTGTTLFQTIGPLIFEDQFIQITTSLSSDYVYGFGENPHSTFKHDFSTTTTSPIFPRDQPVATGNFNQYGQQPYYVNIEDNDGNTHSVLLYSSNAMEYSTFTLTDSSPAITLRTIGGIVDLHFFLGPMPEDVNVQYASAVGTNIFPPYWALGFQLSRYGYNTLDNLRTVRDRMKAAGIPQDVQTCDIDYMDNQRDFTYDTVNWTGFPEFTDELHTDGVKLTLILDPALAIDFSNYPPAADGRDQDVFIKWLSDDLVPTDQESGTGNYMIGYVWPDNKTVFPDFLNPAAQSWWSDQCQIFHNTLSFDALWIDMNEPANFGTNLDRPFNYPTSLPDWSLKCPYNYYDSPPFPTMATYQDINESKRLSDKTICMSAFQTDGTRNYTHYDVHSLYGISESSATYSAMENLFPGKRHHVLSRSTFPGSAKYVSHWLGDNTSDWEQMRMSIIGLLEFSLFGIHHVGADICGFSSDSTEELCARWMELGSFYPFSRNHNTIGAADQDPARPDWPTVNSVSREFLLLRYQYLPYLYTLFHKASVNGNSVVRPLFNEFPSDMASRSIDDQFFWGSAMMIAPILIEGSTQRDVYFPEGLWYDLVTGSLEATGPVTNTVSSPLETIPLYIRGGSIMPYQQPAVTTVLSRQNPFGLTVALNETGASSGDLFWDDGESVTATTDTYMSIIEFANNVLTLNIDHGEEVTNGLNLENAVFYGYLSNPTNVDVNGALLDSSSWTFDDATNVLNVTFSVPLGQNLTMILS